MTRIEREAADWLMRLADGAADDSVIQEFEEWIEASPQHAEAYHGINIAAADLSRARKDGRRSVFR